MLKFILIILVIFFVFGKVIKYALKYMVISTVHKQQQYYSQSAPRETRKEGSIHIDNDQKKSKNKGGNFNDGEYIDYEVVK